MNVMEIMYKDLDTNDLKRFKSLMQSKLLDLNMELIRVVSKLKKDKSSAAAQEINYINEKQRKAAIALTKLENKNQWILAETKKEVERTIKEFSDSLI